MYTPAFTLLTIPVLACTFRGVRDVLPKLEMKFLPNTIFMYKHGHYFVCKKIYTWQSGTCYIGDNFFSPRPVRIHKHVEQLFPAMRWEDRTIVAESLAVLVFSFFFEIPGEDYFTFKVAHGVSIGDREPPPHISVRYDEIFVFSSTTNV